MTVKYGFMRQRNVQVVPAGFAPGAGTALLFPAQLEKSMPGWQGRVLTEFGQVLAYGSVPDWQMGGELKIQNVGGAAGLGFRFPLCPAFLIFNFTFLIGASVPVAVRKHLT
jgi:hypothetical protein